MEWQESKVNCACYRELLEDALGALKSMAWDVNTSVNDDLIESIEKVLKE